MEKVGLIITTLWSVMVGCILYMKWDQVTSMPLNEWGDFLAGVTAPMAFLWLIIGYMLQRKELNLNTKALQDQQNELSKQVDAIREQSDAITRASYQKPF